jgi:protein-disulfide isomerase
MPKIAAVTVVALLSLSPPMQQDEVAQLRKEVEALKAQQATMQRDLDAIKQFLQQLLQRTGAMEDSLLNKSIAINGEPSKGSPKAKVTLIEVSDYHCPFCRRHAQTTQPQIDASFVSSGKIQYVFVDYPIAQLHPKASLAHEGAICAGEQGKYWEMHGRLFADAPPRDPNQLVPQLLSHAQAIGLDVAKFRACVESGKYTKPVSESVSRMEQLGVDSTPTFLVGLTPAPGQPMKILKVVRGALPFSEFKSTIDGLLQ